MLQYFYVFPDELVADGDTFSSDRLTSTRRVFDGMFHLANTSEGDSAMYFRVICVCVSSVLGGCGTFTPRQVAEPSSVTVRDAVFEVATTLRDVQNLVPPEKRAGLLADEVTVVFNVAAASNTTSGADLRISNVALPSGTLAAGVDTKNVSEGTRANQITIKFKNIATADMTKGAFTLKQFQSSPLALSERKTGKQKGDTEKVVDQIRRICAVHPELCPMLQAPEGQ
ncbi:hypothetical protein AB9E29_05030 [Rhizobium leguminosarum]|uniref:hypothetical protein n=1 Tax=Rhizobium leguminosarum TaxID=384 RepID=UPI003F9B2E6B